MKWRLQACVAAALLIASPVQAAQHEFRFKKSDAQSVSVMGEFNCWKGQPMTKGSDGTWSAKVSLPAGSHGYKFLVNGNEWMLDPANPNHKTVDGVENSAIEIKDGDTTTPRPATMPSLAAGPSPADGATDRAHIDFSVLAERKRFDFNRTGNQHTVTTKETWGYKVTLENKSFTPASGCEVQYRQFKFDDALKGSGKLMGVAGATSLDTLRTGQKFTFETTPVEMDKLELRPDWFYADGSKEKVKDRLAGLWLRILRDGEVIFEWQSPSDLKNTVKWE